MNVDKTVFLPLSGFLGAGKTTLMLSAAELLRARGYTVACITNDQGDLLVDSNMVHNQGLPLGQVRGGCFCCRFNDLTDTMNVLIAAHRPDIIIAEAVGSCTDITATVIRPLQALHGDIIVAKPLTSVIDPIRLEEIICTDADRASALSPEISYIFRKQLEEASCLVLNKTDLLPSDRMERLEKLLKEQFPGALIIRASAVHGDGVAEWLDQAMNAVAAADEALDVDYDLYANGEAQLGWLNASFAVEGHIDDAAELCRIFIQRLADGMKAEGAEIAHLKLWAQDDKHELKMSRVRNTDGGRSDVLPPSPWSTNHVTVWLNARIQIDDALLKQQVSAALEWLRSVHQVEVSVYEMECFAPSPPVPTYRMG